VTDAAGCLHPPRPPPRDVLGYEPVEETAREEPAPLPLKEGAMNGLTLGTWDPRWIAAEREAQGLSQAKLARGCGLSVAQVRNVERSRAARVSHVAAVLSALGIENTEELRERHGPRAEDLRFDGPTLRALREERKLSQSAVARRAGVNISTLRQLEGAYTDPSVRVAVRVLRALGVADQLPRFLVVPPAVVPPPVPSAAPAAAPAPAVEVPTASPPESAP